MAYKLSYLAEQDIENIYDYSIENSGVKQAKRYYSDLQKIFDLLMINPRIGTMTYGLYRYPCGRHMIFYQQRQNTIFIVRILHERMLPKRHLS